MVKYIPVEIKNMRKINVLLLSKSILHLFPYVSEIGSYLSGNNTSSVLILYLLIVLLLI